MSFTYLASPYSHTDPHIIQHRFECAEAYVAAELRKGHAIYSPIVHCHAFAEKYNLPTDYDFWKTYNHTMLSVAARMEVLMLDGWDTSTGIVGESKFARSKEIPIFYTKYEPYAFYSDERQ